MVALLQALSGGDVALAETLLAYSEPVSSESGTQFHARACGAESGHTWQGWIEFIPVDGGTIVRSGRETTQPNRNDLVYWATGLTPVYLQGALRRALQPLNRPVAAPSAAPTFDGPAPDFTIAPATTESVLNPLSVYRKGEAHLTNQLRALSAWHLVNIVRSYSLSQEPIETVNALTHSELVDLIVASTRARMGGDTSVAHYSATPMTRSSFRTGS
jgi:hypothetical protein